MKNDIMVGGKQKLSNLSKNASLWQPRSMGTTEDPREHVPTLFRGWPKKQFPPLEKEMNEEKFPPLKKEKKKFPTVEEGIEKS